MRLSLLIPTILLPASLSAQGLASRVAAAPDGQVHFSYAARPGVCGNGDNISVHSDRDRDWESECQSGPVRIALTKSGGSVERVRVHVGGRWVEGSGTELGTVSDRAAVDYLLALAPKLTSKGGDAVFATTLADSVTVWPRLADLARDQSVPNRTRRDAIFWLGQAAGDKITASLDSIAMSPGDREVQRAAVFALSQRPDGEGVPALIKVAQTSPDRDVRKQALFWLGQSNDPRAVSLFENILTGR